MKKKMMLIVGTIIIVLTICFSGCVEHNETINENPCPDSDPTGGVHPKGKLEYISIYFHGPLDFSEIIKKDGSVNGTWDQRTAKVNFTIYNGGNVPITTRISFKEGIDCRDENELWLKSKVWIVDPDNSLSSLVYDYHEWVEDNWICSTYTFWDASCMAWENSSKTLVLEYQLDGQPAGSFMDGQVYRANDYYFGLYVSEEWGGNWQYFPFEVRT